MYESSMFRIGARYKIKTLIDQGHLHKILKASQIKSLSLSKGNYPILRGTIIDEMVQELKERPIAIHQQEANEQHYEVSQIDRYIDKKIIELKEGAIAIHQ